MHEEPSVLDYLKSRLKFWEPGEKIRIPDEFDLPKDAPSEAILSVEVQPSALPGEQDSMAMAKLPLVKPAEPNRWPWRSLLALALALLAQRAWEPMPNRTATVGLVLYALALVLLVWALINKEWSLAPLPETKTASDMLQVRWLPLVVAFPLTLAAFLTLNNNLFTPFN